MPRALILLCVLTLYAAPARASGLGDAVIPEHPAAPEASQTPSPRVPRLMFLVTSLAGSGEPGFANGRGARASLSKPSGVTVGPSGLVYVSDTDNHCIRQLDYDGQLKTLAGAPERGLADGVGAVARFAKPQGIAADASGNLFVADRGNLCIRKITPEGRVSTFAGPQRDASGISPLAMAAGVAIDAGGTLYVTSSLHNSVVKVTPDGTLSAFVGGGPAGFRDGKGADAQFFMPEGIAVDAQGTLYVADKFNHRIRKVSPEGVVSTLAGTGEAGHQDGAGAQAQFSSPSGLALDKNGVLYVADSANHRIRRITPDGEVSSAAGSDAWGGEDGTGAKAQFKSPVAVAVDGAGNLRVVDAEDHRLREITVVKVTKRSR